MDNMNKLRIIIGALVAMTAAACDLDRFPIDKINPDTFFQTEQDLDLYAMSFYEILPEGELRERIAMQIEDTVRKAF